MVKYKPPWFWFILKWRFDVEWQNTALVWGNDIYTSQELQDHVKEHENVHRRQQGNKVKGLWWWAKYLISDDFRFEQELEAYFTQYKFVKEKYGNKTAERILDRVSKELSSERYGNLLSQEKAKKAILEVEKIYEN